MPVVAEKFITGRRYRNEGINDPSFCDLAQLLGVVMDNKAFSDIRIYIDRALKEGGWLILGGHEIKPTGKYLTTYTSMLKELFEYVNNSNNHIWIAPVKDVANYINSHRLEIKNN